MAKNLVIVESPAKAKTIKKFLGSSYKIEASMGHVRDLPKSELGINFENNFEPKYITIRGKGELLSKLRKEAKNADRVYLATDPDREGEAISWHLKAALKLDDKKEVHRITFNEITKTAVKNSIKQARPIDMDLVDAQQSRRMVDRIVGYSISPLLWKKVRRRLSAGRVQSACLKIICDREEEIQAFEPEEYWTVEAVLSGKKRVKFTAKYYGTDNEKKDIKTKDEADKIVSEIEKSQPIVSSVKKGTRTRKPYPPFTTSTLQQEAAKQLGFSTQKTMRIAQQLYEGIDVEGEGTVGIISYIRTDSVRLSDEAYEDASNYVVDKYGTDYKNPEKIVYKTKGRAQDAHEAIRPTSVMREPSAIAATASKDQYKLYRLIWERMVSSVMSAAVFDTLQIKIEADKHSLRASGQVLSFEGFMKVYAPKEDAKEEGKMSSLVNIEEQMELKPNKVEGSQHFTMPLPRYTEASLVKTLEEVGIGRPSTYAPTITTILARGYVIKEAKLLYPTELGEIVNDIMKNYFSDIVNIDFTANMEQALDMVEEGRRYWKDVITDFYYPFEKTLEYAEKEIGEIEIEDEKTDVICEKCGSNMVIKYGKYGKFLACPNFPDCRNAKPYLEDTGVKCPLCQGKIMIKKTKKGRRYYGCENNPDCEFMTWDKPREEKCPKCGGVLTEKGSKNITVACINDSCNYRKKLDHE